MSKYYVLFNPLAGNNTGRDETVKLTREASLQDHELLFTDMTKLESYKAFFSALSEDDKIILSGGDGTINRFVNDTIDIDIKNDIYYYATGTGNDFVHELGKKKGDTPFLINDYIKDLPTVTVNGNAQDAVGDTMNDGLIIVHGNIGDAAGYAMRGGRIYIRGNAGYRAGIHMKAYENKVPVMIIGGHAGSFLGEYQAGGIIVVLNLTDTGAKIVSNFPCTGMHGGKMYLRSDCSDVDFPEQVTARPADEADLAELEGSLSEYCTIFGYDPEEILSAPFTVVTPNTANPYVRMYVAN